MRNRLIALILWFLGVALVGGAQTKTDVQKFLEQNKENAPIRIMDYNTKTKMVNLTYIINREHQLYNMTNDHGTFTNVNAVDGNFTYGISVDGNEAQPVSSKTMHEHAVWTNTNEVTWASGV